MRALVLAAASIAWGAAPGLAARLQEPAAPPVLEAPVPVRAEAGAPGKDEPQSDEAKAAAARARAEQIATLFEGTLADSHNSDDFAETPGYRRLLELLFNYQRAEVSQRARTDFDYAECVKYPDLWRGEFVRIRGVIVDPQAVKLLRPISGREDVWRGVVTEADGSEGVMFDMLDRPPDGLTDRRSVVDLEGLVYRNVRYENRDGKFHEVPYLLVRSVTEVNLDKEPKHGVVEPFMAVLIGAAVVFLIGRILWTMRQRSGPSHASRSRPPNFHEMFERANANARRASKDRPAK